MAWELINEGRCKSDLSGRTMQAWIEEMAPFVKAIDGEHLLEVGLEGFYGGLDHDQEAIQHDSFASSRNVGTDFISNNQVHAIDFATIHLYPSWYVLSTMLFHLQHNLKTRQYSNKPLSNPVVVFK